MTEQVKQRLSDAVPQIQKEIASLLGVEFTLTSGEVTVVTREALAALQPGKCVCARLAVSGDVRGTAGIIVRVKAGIRMGGLLLMLPSSELEESISREEFSEEIKESFGEIASVVSGALSGVFQDSPACEFARGEEIIFSLKNLEDEQPLPGDSFCSFKIGMSLEGDEIGDLVVALPAVEFGFDASEGAGAEETSAEKESSETAAEESVEEDPVEEAGVPGPIGYDPEKNRKKIDELLAECEQELSEEVGSLLGTKVSFSGMENTLVDRKTFFDSYLDGTQIFADMELVRGEEHLGEGWFVSPIGGAIRLGGVLVMLPDSELDNSEKEEDFYEDLADAYGEIANIVSGVYTRIFQKKYSLKSRFVKKELKEVKPLKDEEILEDIQYYCSSMNFELSGRPPDRVHMLLPAKVMQVVGVDEIVNEAQAVEAVVEENYPVGEELDTHKARLDSLLGECQKRIRKEISDLCGVKVTLENLTTEVVKKDEFILQHLSGTQVLAHLDLVGEVEAKSYLVVSLAASIYMGGVLVMLPPSELEAAIEEEDFNEDVADAWGEIANIVTGAYTSRFEELYKKKVRFIRKEIEEVIPAKVDLASDEPMPPGDYYLTSMALDVDGRELGKVNLLIPLSALDLQGLVRVPERNEEEKKEAIAEGRRGEADDGPEDSLGSDAVFAGVLDVLLVGDDPQSADQMIRLLEKRGLCVKTLSFKDEVLNYIGESLKVVYIVMKEINEQAFGVAIKISSRSSLPIIAAGPAWTRSKVIKAVKYGVQDILVLPGTDVEIEENFKKYLS